MSETRLHLNWECGNGEGWNLDYSRRHISYVVFTLDRLPNFSEPRFRELGEQLDDRRSQIARRQLQMLRQLHSLGSDYGISMRLCKDDERLRLFVVIRAASTRPLSSAELSALTDRVQQMFPKAYHLRRVDRGKNQTLWRKALDVSWANYVNELIKPETLYPANLIPYFYSSSLWRSHALHDLEALCRQLLNISGNALIEVTLVPTEVNEEERKWVDRHTQRMREARRGDRLTDSRGHPQQAFDPMPMLQTPVENYESWLKRYNESPVFLYAIRVFASDLPAGLTQALSVSASRSQAQIIQVSRSHPRFGQEVDAARDVRVLPEVHNPWWDDTTNSVSPLRPWRVQRIHRMADVEEIASFWRFPIPVRPGFPGFELDTGTIIDGPPQSGQKAKIYLGTYTDTAARNDLRAEFDREGLVKHGLIVGVPGSGKTTAVFNMLHQLWAPQWGEDGIPFIVLEPAKTEYRALKTLPAFQEDLLVFTLGDERISPLRFNPFELPEGIPLESHIARLNACFIGAFNLFDPLPLLLDQTIRESYEAKGWFDDSVGGEPGLEPPTLSEVCLQAENVLARAGYVGETQGNIRAALLQRLNSLRRGSKGRMLDTRRSIPFDELMQRPVVLELDALNGDEKALLMMFVLTSVYEYAKATRRSGTPLSHILVVEEAHNLIGRSQIGSEHRANPQVHAIRLFIQMLAEMRALGQGILIADQLPTAIAPEAMKQTNLKLLLRMTAIDDRTEIGNTMDLDAEHLKAVSRFKSGQAYIYHEGLDRVRQVQTVNFKEEHGVAQPPRDEDLSAMMASFELQWAQLYMPFPECTCTCKFCDRRVHSQVHRFLRAFAESHSGADGIFIGSGPICDRVVRKIKVETMKIKERYGSVSEVFPYCAFIHLVHARPKEFSFCQRHEAECRCKDDEHAAVIRDLLDFGRKQSQ